jgi:hypothetical protein
MPMIEEAISGILSTGQAGDSKAHYAKCWNYLPIQQFSGEPSEQRTNRGLGGERRPYSFPAMVPISM